MASRRCWVVIPSCTSAESTYVNSDESGQANSAGSSPAGATAGVSAPNARSGTVR